MCPYVLVSVSVFPLPRTCIQQIGTHRRILSPLPQGCESCSADTVTFQWKTSGIYLQPSLLEYEWSSPVFSRKTADYRQICFYVVTVCCRTWFEPMEVSVVVAVCGNSPEIYVIVISLQKIRSALYRVRNEYQECFLGVKAAGA
jgi:hypothetical protein